MIYVMLTVLIITVCLSAYFLGQARQVKKNTEKIESYKTASYLRKQKLDQETNKKWKKTREEEIVINNDELGIGSGM